MLILHFSYNHTIKHNTTQNSIHNKSNWHFAREWKCAKKSQWKSFNFICRERAKLDCEMSKSTRENHSFYTNSLFQSYNSDTFTPNQHYKQFFCFFKINHDARTSNSIEHWKLSHSLGQTKMIRQKKKTDYFKYCWSKWISKPSVSFLFVFYLSHF